MVKKVIVNEENQAIDNQAAQQPQAGFAQNTQQTASGNRYIIRTPNQALGNQTFQEGSDRRIKDLAEAIKKMPELERLKNTHVIVVDKKQSQYEESFLIVATKAGDNVHTTTIINQSTLRKTIKESVPASSARFMAGPLLGIQNGNNIEYSVPVVPSDFVQDKDFKEVAVAALRAAGVKVKGPENVLRAGVLTIPKATDLEDENRLSELMYWAISEIQQSLASDDTLGADGTHPYLNYTPLSEMQGSPVEIHIQPNEHGTQESSFGMPVHTPIRFNISRTITSNGSGLRDEGGSIGYLGCYMDALLIPKDQRDVAVQQAVAAASAQPHNPELMRLATIAQEQKYRAVLVLTKNDRYQGSSSPQDLLFNLATLPTIMDNNFHHKAWCSADNPANVNPLHDIGAFGFENPLSSNVDANGVPTPERIVFDTASQAAQCQMISRIFHKDVSLAVDVLQSGTSRFFNNLFSDEPANKQRLMQAAYEITNGTILEFFDDSQSVILQKDGLTPWGVFTDKNGALRDSREVFNYLGWLNHAYQGKKPNIDNANVQMDRWSFAMENSHSNTPDVTRFMEKLEMLNEITNGQFQMIDKLERRYVNPAFINALRQAIAKNKVGFVNTSHQEVRDNVVHRGAAFLSNLTGGLGITNNTQTVTGWTQGQSMDFGNGFL